MASPLRGLRFSEKLRSLGSEEGKLCEAKGTLVSRPRWSGERLAHGRRKIALRKFSADRSRPNPT
jgi:hypothetical protein